MTDTPSYSTQIVVLIGRVFLVLLVVVVTVVWLYLDWIVFTGLFGGRMRETAGGLFHWELRLLAVLPLSVTAIQSRGFGAVALPWIAAVSFAVFAIYLHRKYSIEELPWWPSAGEIALAAGFVAAMAIALGLLVTGHRRVGAILTAVLSTIGLAVVLLTAGHVFEIVSWSVLIIGALIVALRPSRSAWDESRDSTDIGAASE